MEVSEEFLEDVKAITTLYKGSGQCINYTTCDSILEEIDNLLGKWIKLEDDAPLWGEIVEVKDDSGNTYQAFICKHCGKEWRCGMTGFGLMIDVVYWRPIKK